MRITYDKASDSKYISFSRTKKRAIVERTKKLADWLLLDYAKNDDLLGVEILNASKHEGVLVTGANLVSYTLNSASSKQSPFASAFVGEDSAQIPVSGYVHA